MGCEIIVSLSAAVATCAGGLPPAVGLLAGLKVPSEAQLPVSSAHGRMILGGFPVLPPPPCAGGLPPAGVPAGGLPLSSWNPIGGRGAGSKSFCSKKLRGASFGFARQ